MGVAGLNPTVVKPLTQRIQAIETLRFIAAMLVVCVHIPALAFGAYGVDIFFIISGIVMMMCTETSSDKFFLRRIIRIAPIYYIFTLLVFLIAVLVPTWLNNTTANPVHLIKSLLFVPFDKNGVGHTPVLFLGWTLNFEMYFYLLFAIALKLSHKYRGEITSVFIVTIWFLTSFVSEYPLMAYNNSVVIEFIMGMALYHVLFAKRYGQAMLCMALIGLSVVLSPDLLQERGIKYGLPCLVFVAIFLWLLKDKPMPKWSVMLGGASYALYLTHPYIIQAFDKVFGWFDKGAAYQVSATILSVILVNLLAVAIFYWLEKPIQRYLRQKFL